MSGVDFVRAQKEEGGVSRGGGECEVRRENELAHFNNRGNSYTTMIIEAHLIFPLVTSLLSYPI